MLAECDRINDKKRLKEWIAYERERYGGSIIKELLCLTERDILRKHQVILRKTEYYVNTGKKLLAGIYKIKLYKIQNKYAIHIPVNVCDKGLKIMHVGSVLINKNAIVGKDCVFHINTAVVAGGTNNSVPVICDGVVVGVGAVLLGNIKVAKNVAIGANAVVNKNVEEENIAVAGIPAHKVSNGGSLNWNKK